MIEVSIPHSASSRAYCTTRRTAAGHPDEQPLALFSHLGQRCAVYPLGAEHVDVVEFSQLLRRERFRRSEDHVPGIVHEDIEPALFGNNLADRRFDGFLRKHVQFNGTQVLPLLILLEPFEIRKINKTQPFCPVRLPIQSPGCRSHRLAKPHMTGIGVKSWMPRHQEMKRMQLVWCFYKA